MKKKFNQIVRDSKKVLSYYLFRDIWVEAVVDKEDIF